MLAKLDVINNDIFKGIVVSRLVSYRVNTNVFSQMCDLEDLNLEHHDYL